ncbi:hypothetical protein JRO89_XS09G0206100 [Xanthoceras sorbifolium]|uniref:Sieve element occlusion C-terminal domain-containing protein n=1 Tax=Xanthoceras sorbifolium TaxID=99658 RepID=A0ABQ8HMD2_9ROSI|nr:hypothetical protein JRO89_XS09G0206100 [Xanthoceras sorbifolium]
MYKETEFTSQNQRQNLTTLQYRFGAILLSWQEALWREGPWSIELLADTLHPYLPVWVQYIFTEILECECLQFISFQNVVMSGFMKHTVLIHCSIMTKLSIVLVLACIFQIEQEKYTCLYGGEAIDWIRRFTLTAKGVAQAETILLEMFYAGNSNPKRKVARKIATFYCRESEPHIERHPSHLLLLDVAGKHVVHQIHQLRISLKFLVSTGVITPGL